ncbi:hypothetical protein [Candidatus Enterovibrio escicola]|uniref:Mobile element protein n=1 Tax=Candidatus Enterovibrio escicola TaxID=1927127 RepID=A0A2A5T3J5_9GAMM|nr:hypothetical protein [Candidatus Enterovibrio escacola]PCS22726.1 hypothetical protein BTN49_1684 [Candidatus Enterovibrio escacola]
MADITIAIIQLLIPCKQHVHTIMADNGPEFSHYEKIAKALDIDIYFAHLTVHGNEG